jgi:hypothetical protein
LNVEEYNLEWKECNRVVSSHLKSTNWKSSFSILEEILQKHIPVLLFVGDNDVICNYIGIEDMMSVMNFGQIGFKVLLILKEGEFQDWKVSNKTMGKYIKENNLTYIRVFNASHMLPYDAPEAALEILKEMLFSNDVQHGKIELPVLSEQSHFPALVFIMTIFCLGIMIGLYVQRNMSRRGWKRLNEDFELEVMGTRGGFEQ